MAKKLGIAGSFCIFFLFLCMLSSCGPASYAEETEPPTVITADLSLDVLYDILAEKGDDIRFSDIPDQYFYVISSALVPQLRYPIDENTSFYIMQLSEGEFSIILTVATEEGSLDYSGAEEIMSYIEGLSESAEAD